MSDDSSYPTEIAALDAGMGLRVLLVDAKPGSELDIRLTRIEDKLDLVLRSLTELVPGAQKTL